MVSLEDEYRKAQFTVLRNFPTFYRLLMLSTLQSQKVSAGEKKSTSAQFSMRVF